MPRVSDGRTGDGGGGDAGHALGEAARAGGEAVGLGEGDAEGEGEVAARDGEAEVAERADCPGLIVAAVCGSPPSRPPRTAVKATDPRTSTPTTADAITQGRPR